MAYEGNNQAIWTAIEQRAITKAAQTLIGVCTGILADGALHDREIQFLSTWLTEHQELTKYWPGTELHRRVQEILSDGHISDDERQDLVATLTDLCGNQFSITGAAVPDGPTLPIDDDPSIFFRNTAFCFTGRFAFGTRAACERAVLKLGSIAADRITKNLNYLVIGSFIERQWINTTYGRKIEKAVAYRDEGIDLTIVSETQWIAAMADTGKTKI